MVGLTRARLRSQRPRSAIARLLELAPSTASGTSALYGSGEQVSASRVTERIEEQKKRFGTLRRYNGDVKNHVKYHGPRPPYHLAGGTPRGLRHQPEAAWGIPQIPQRGIFLIVFHVAVLTPQSDLRLSRASRISSETPRARSYVQSIDPPDLKG